MLEIYDALAASYGSETWIHTVHDNFYSWVFYHTRGRKNWPKWGEFSRLIEIINTELQSWCYTFASFRPVLVELLAYQEAVQA